MEFKLPELGENISSADIVKVLVSAGDKIEKDTPVIEIETDKATIEVPADVSGVVSKVFVKEGSKAKVGEVIFTFEQSGSGSAPAPKAAAPAAGKPSEAKVPEKKSEPAAYGKSGLYEFLLPELGENIPSADITKVLVSAGGKVSKDQTLIEIETDKANVEVPSEVSGTIKEVKIKAGDKAKVGQVLFIIETSDAVEIKQETKKETPAAQPARQPIAEHKEERTSTVSLPIHKNNLPDKIAPASPTVRRFAREIGIDIHQVGGSGPGGRISIEDVKRFAKNINEKISKGGGGFGIARQPLPDFSKWGEINREPMSNIRRKTAEHLSYAWATVPHVTQFDKVDITELEVLRKKFGKQVEQTGGKLTVTAILLKVIAGALKAFPQFNTSVDMEKNEVVYKKYYNIGVAVDTDRGLLVPVIRDVDKKNIKQLAAELAEVSKKARDKKLGLDDMQGGNFSISNLGGIGGTYFTPIVNSPEVAILGVSKASYEPVYMDGKFEPRLMMPVSLSYDHRIIDGADGARFLRWVVEALENPFLLSLEG